MLHIKADDPDNHDGVITNLDALLLLLYVIVLLYNPQTTFKLSNNILYRKELSWWLKW